MIKLGRQHAASLVLNLSKLDQISRGQVGSSPTWIFINLGRPPWEGMQSCVPDNRTQETIELRRGKECSLPLLAEPEEGQTHREMAMRGLSWMSLECSRSPPEGGQLGLVQCMQLTYASCSLGGPGMQENGREWSNLEDPGIQKVSLGRQISGDSPLLTSADCVPGGPECFRSLTVHLGSGGSAFFLKMELRGQSTAHLAWLSPRRTRNAGIGGDGSKLDVPGALQVSSGW